jgi:hypothetical protein
VNVKTGKFRYYPKLEVTFSLAEVEFLLACSQRHYDWRCREVGQCGGFLFGIKNYFIARENEVETTVELDSTELNLLMKILESGGPPALSLALSKDFRLLNDEFSRINGL